MAGLTPAEKNNFDSYRFSEKEMYSYLYAFLDAPPHTHTDFYEFSLVTYGEFENIYHNERILLPKNTLIFFRVGEKHAIYPRKPGSLHFSFVIKAALLESLFAQFFPEDNLEALGGYEKRQLDPVQGEYLVSLINQLLDNSRINCRNRLMRLFVYNVLSHFLITPPREEPAVASTTQAVNDLIMRLNELTYVRHKVHEIYKDYPVAQSTLISEFKKKTGYTIVQYHTIKKLDYAAQLLASSTHTITEVCSMLNFSSLSHFSKIFKERFHTTPREYQRFHSQYRVPDENLIGLS